MDARGGAGAVEEKRGAKRDPEDAEELDEVVPKTREGEEAAVVSAAGAVEEEEREPGEVAELEEPPAEVKGGGPVMGASGV